MSYVKAILFYAIVGIPAYLLLFFGLKGLGYIPVTYYSSTSYYNPTGTQTVDVVGYLANFTPIPTFSYFFLVVAGGIFIGMGLRAVLKYKDR